MSTTEIDNHNIILYALRRHGWGLTPGNMPVRTFEIGTKYPDVAPLIPFFFLKASKQLTQLKKTGLSKLSIGSPPRDGATSFIATLQKHVQPVVFIPVEVYLANKRGKIDRKFYKNHDNPEKKVDYQLEAVVERLREVRKNPDLLAKKSILAHDTKACDTLIAYIKSLPPLEPDSESEDSELSSASVPAPDLKTDEELAKLADRKARRKFFPENGSRLATLAMSATSIDEIVAKLREEIKALKQERTSQLRELKKEQEVAQREHKAQVAAARKAKRLAKTSDKKDSLSALSDASKASADFATLTPEQRRYLPYVGEWLAWIEDETSAAVISHAGRNFVPHYLSFIAKCMEAAHRDLHAYYNGETTGVSEHLQRIHMLYEEVDTENRGRQDVGILKSYRPGVDQLFSVPEAPSRKDQGGNVPWLIYPYQALSNATRQIKNLNLTNSVVKKMNKNPAHYLPDHRSKRLTQPVIDLLESSVGLSAPPIAFPMNKTALSDTKKTKKTEDSGTKGSAKRGTDKKRKRTAASESSTNTKPPKKRQRAEATEPTKKKKANKGKVAGSPKKKTQKKRSRAERSASSHETEKPPAKRTNAPTSDSSAINFPELFKTSPSATTELATLVDASDLARAEERVDAMKARLLSSEEAPLATPPGHVPDHATIGAFYEVIDKTRSDGGKFSMAEKFEPLLLLKAASTMMNTSKVVWAEARRVHDEAAHNDADITSTAMEYMKSTQNAKHMASLAASCYTSSLLVNRLFSDVPFKAVEIAAQ